MSGQALTEKILQRAVMFSKQFEDSFHLSNKGYSQEKIVFAQSALSNLIGGIGSFLLAKLGNMKRYFYGQWTTVNDNTGELTAMPARVSVR